VTAASLALAALLVLCEDCRKREASVGCLLCRKNLCADCYDKHMLAISADMNEGFAGFEYDRARDDQPIVCEVCGMEIASEQKDEHLFEQHGISI